MSRILYFTVIVILINCNATLNATMNQRFPRINTHTWYRIKSFQAFHVPSEMNGYNVFFSSRFTHALPFENILCAAEIIENNCGLISRQCATNNPATFDGKSRQEKKFPARIAPTIKEIQITQWIFIYHRTENKMFLFVTRLGRAVLCDKCLDFTWLTNCTHCYWTRLC